MPGPDMKPRIRLQARIKMRPAPDVIIMGVRQEQVGIERAFAAQSFAQFRKAGASIKNQQMLTAAHFDTRGVAAIARSCLTRARNAASHAPKAHEEIELCGHAFPRRVFHPELAAVCLKRHKGESPNRIQSFFTPATQERTPEVGFAQIHHAVPPPLRETLRQPEKSS